METNVCGWCGKECQGDFCSEDCHTQSLQAYKEDMATLFNDLCIVCQERPMEDHPHICMDVGCKESWAMAWEK